MKQDSFYAEWPLNVPTVTILPGNSVTMNLHDSPNHGTGKVFKVAPDSNTDLQIAHEARVQFNAQLTFFVPALE